MQGRLVSQVVRTVLVILVAKSLFPAGLTTFSVVPGRAGVSYRGAFALSDGRQPSLAIASGYLLHYLVGPTPLNSIELRAFELGTSRAFSIKVNTPRELIEIEDATVTDDKTIVIAGSSYSSRLDRRLGFLTRVTLDGVILADLELGSYHPSRVCAVRDIIWTFGFGLDESRSEGKTERSALRIVDDKGNSADSALSYNELLDRGVSETSKPYLTCDSNHESLFFETSGFLFEISNTGSEFKAISVSMPSGMQVTGFVQYAPGLYFASLAGNRMNNFGLHGLYSLNEQFESPLVWIPVIGTLSGVNSPPDCFYVLLGQMNSQLLYLNNVREAAVSVTLPEGTEPL